MSAYSSKMIYIIKDMLHAYPPCMSQIVILRELGCEVIVIGEVCDEKTRIILKEAGVSCFFSGDLNPKRSFVGRIRHWIGFNKFVKKKMKPIYKKNDVIWIGTERTGIVINGCLKNKKIVLNVLELYNRRTAFGRGVGKCLKFASAVVACELNRARIMQMWYNLKELPFVMPNKPYYELECEISEKATVFSKILKDNKCILYQGILDTERPLDTIAEALKKTKEHYTFVIIGKGKSDESDNEYIEKLRRIYPDVIYGGYYPAPQHLYITQRAYIGIAIYDTSSLNTLFCAPNKTFEYAKFGVPILGNDIPGLQLTVEKYSAGICADIDDPTEIAKAIDEISRNYKKYQAGTKRFYDSVDNRKVIKQILEKVGL